MKFSNSDEYFLLRHRLGSNAAVHSERTLGRILLLREHPFQPAANDNSSDRSGDSDFRQTHRRLHHPEDICGYYGIFRLSDRISRRCGAGTLYGGNRAAGRGTFDGNDGMDRRSDTGGDEHSERLVYGHGRGGSPGAGETERTVKIIELNLID